MEWLEAAFRWIHVVAGVLWIGLLYFFNWVNGPFAKTLDADAKKKVIPQLAPRALYFFRWGSAFTWISGLLLLAVVYYHAIGYMTADPAGHFTAVGIGFAVILVGAVAYDQIWKSALAQNANVAIGVSFVLLVSAMVFLTKVGGLTGRAMFIHVGSLLGTTMAMNVWMRIWPAQRRIIAAVRDGQAPSPADAGLAALRSRHNTYMSVPLIYTMVSSHHPSALDYGDNQGWIVLSLCVVLGWAAVFAIYRRADSAVTTRF